MRHTPHATHRSAIAVAVTAIAALSLAGCASETPTAGETDPGSAATTSGTFPVTLDNCGFEASVPAEPQRIVTIKSSMTELALALGASDRIVGSAFPDGPLPDDLVSDAPDTVTDPMSDQVPGTESLLALEPDLVLAGWESNLTAEEAGDRSMLGDLGVATYVAPSACKEKEYQPNPMSFDALFDQITEAGAVLGTPDAAAALVESQRAELEALTPDDRGLSAVWFSSGSDIPYVGAGIGTPEMIMSGAGLTNIAADVEDTWTSMGWESIVAKNPDVIVLVDAAWNSADSKIDTLESNPATAELVAVKKGHYLTLPFPATEAGVRSVGAVGSLIEQLEAVAP